jgi:hypothetical protein
MKKLLLLFTAAVLFSCSKDDYCPNGKIVGHRNNYGVCSITLDNGRTIVIPCGQAEFDKYPSNTCYEGTK